MILHRNGHGHGSGKSYHKTFFFFFFFFVSYFFRCLHWVDIQYLDTYFGFICFRMAWNNGVSEIATRRVHPVIYHLPSIFLYNDSGSSVFTWSLLSIMS
ncbi:uncharacterized protein ASPGLDRAFT_289800 [Aspergillus glaucus CBS 516.65]|uniref:Uncharacterized protein n=1 Tax=Aspergillus glaucus CBS 516.65 TaxID=1160497 RepID=A0A1L9VJJ8_ASPGL|nr:hypothetical protein ASPGLDRAFT_289800 [Aspergillus glaucus CBS 516.65]OJJ84106.1 hypothetical protein ASPGLDRAFT_289800 [Aspergillus glaucus CBS 516.65]